MTIGLLASLTIVNTVASGQALVLDARLGALAAAGLALMLPGALPGGRPRRRRRGGRTAAAGLELSRLATVFSPYLPPEPRGSIRI